MSREEMLKYLAMDIAIKEQRLRILDEMGADEELVSTWEEVYRRNIHAMYDAIMGD